MVRTDTSAKKGSHPEAEVIQDLDLVKGVIVVEVENGRSQGPGAERGRSQGPEAGRGSVGLGLDQGQDQDIGIEPGVEVEPGAEAGKERRELKNHEDLAEA